jgi:exopolysaccharide biosynthesis protein
LAFLANQKRNIFMRGVIYCLGLLFSCQLWAQTSADSLALITADWNTTQLDYGLLWKKKQFDKNQLFNANQSINILEIKRFNRHIKFAFATADTISKIDFNKGKLIKTSQLAKKNNALAAVNGGFFDTKNGGSVDFFKVNGHITDTTRWEANKPLSFHAKAGIMIHKNKLKIVKGEDRWRWYDALKTDNLLLSGPLLMYNGQVEVLPKTAFNDNRHPRTCICTTDDKRVLLVTVDGRSNQAFGMNLAELTFLMKNLGCKNAINLDGGGSTTLYIDGQPYSGVVNYPCDNKLFDHEGERAVSNILMIQKRK